MGKVAQIRSTGSTSPYKGGNAKDIARMLREGHTVEEVAFMFRLTNREVRRAARRAGLWV